MEIYWPPESQQSMNQLVRQALVDQRERLFKKMSQMKQDLTSTSDQLRVYKEEKCDLEAENLRLRTEVEGLQSEKGELKSKCDDLQQFKTTITTAVHQQAGKENTQMSL
jgi:regulator of replication initiation timing